MNSGIINWLDSVFNYLLKEKPQIKVHGFGMTNQQIIERFPWYSIDSTSFDRAQRFGIVTLLNDNTGKIYTIHVNKWKQEKIKEGIPKELLDDAKYIRQQTVKLGIETFWKYQEKINNNNINYDYLLNQQSLF